MYVGLTSTTRDSTAGSPVAALPAAPPRPAAPRPATPETPTRSGRPPAWRCHGADKPAALPGTNPVEHTVDIDTQTRTIIYRSKDPLTGAVVFQVPDEAKVRLRAYLEDMAQHQAAAATAGTHPDPSTIDSIRI